MRMFCCFASVLAHMTAVVGLSAQEPQLNVSGNPQALTVHTAIAGLAPSPATDMGTSYSLTLSQSSSVVAQLDGPLPAGVTLRIRLVAPPGGTSAGWVNLSTGSTTLVISVPPGTYAGLAIAYELSATLTAGVIPLSSRQISFTVVPAW